ncbi:MAG: ferritin-like domain-containing protein [Streptosporangiales bacterium]|nr:ferritin-like domain-containing protein [Streptosporangiales bacterium]
MVLDIDPRVHAFTKVEYNDLDYGSFHARPLRNPTLRALRYMFDVERHTICFLRDLLVTPTHKDATATAFLTRWAFEDFWHSEAVSRVLTTHGIVIDNALIQRMRNALGRRDSFAPVYRSVIANVIGDDITAVQMTWGAVNEWSAQLAYDRIGELDDHPELLKLLDRIRTQRVRHARFYADEARARLATSRRARAITRTALDRLWGPLGSTIHPRHETALVFRYLLGGTDAWERVDEIDRAVGDLPGLGRQVVRAALGRYGIGPEAGRRPTVAERLRVAPSPRRWRQLSL